MPCPISALCVCFSPRTPRECSSGRVKVWKENLFTSFGPCREKQPDGRAAKCPNRGVLLEHNSSQGGYDQGRRCNSTTSLKLQVSHRADRKSTRLNSSHLVISYAV